MMPTTQTTSVAPTVGTCTAESPWGGAGGEPGGTPTQDSDGTGGVDQSESGCRADIEGIAAGNSSLQSPVQGALA